MKTTQNTEKHSISKKKIRVGASPTYPLPSFSVIFRFFLTWQNPKCCPCICTLYEACCFSYTPTTVLECDGVRVRGHTPYIIRSESATICNMPYLPSLVYSINFCFVIYYSVLCSMTFFMNYNYDNFCFKRSCVLCFRWVVWSVSCIHRHCQVKSYSPSSSMYFNLKFLYRGYLQKWSFYCNINHVWMLRCRLCTLKLLQYFI